MADTTKVRIGLEGARELELDSADAASIRNALDAAVAAGDPVLWVHDARGTEYGLVTSKIAFLEIEGIDVRSGVGFNLGAADVVGGG